MTDEPVRVTESKDTKGDIPTKVDSKPPKPSETKTTESDLPLEGIENLVPFDHQLRWDFEEQIKNLKNQLEQHTKESSNMIEDIESIKLEMNMIEKEIKLIKPLIVDYRKIDLPSNFYKFIEECKTIFPDLKLFLKKRKENIVVYINFPNDFEVENEVKFYDMFSDMEIANIEYKFETMIVRDGLTEDYEKLI